MKDAWITLGLEPTADRRAVKRAYARRLKSIDRSDTAAFMDLRMAYEAVLGSVEESGPADRTISPRMDESDMEGDRPDQQRPQQESPWPNRGIGSPASPVAGNDSLMYERAWECLARLEQLVVSDPATIPEFLDATMATSYFYNLDFRSIFEEGVIDIILRNQGFPVAGIRCLADDFDWARLQTGVDGGRDQVLMEVLQRANVREPLPYEHLQKPPPAANQRPANRENEHSGSIPIVLVIAGIFMLFNIGRFVCSPPATFRDRGRPDLDSRIEELRRTYPNLPGPQRNRPAIE